MFEELTFFCPRITVTILLRIAKFYLVFTCSNNYFKCFLCTYQCYTRGRGPGGGGGRQGHLTMIICPRWRFWTNLVVFLTSFYRKYTVDQYRLPSGQAFERKLLSNAPHMSSLLPSASSLTLIRALVFMRNTCSALLICSQEPLYTPKAGGTNVHHTL